MKPRAPLTVLVVDDEPRSLETLRRTLEEDFTVFTAQARPGSMGRPFDVIGQLAPDHPDPAAAVREMIEQAAQRGRTVLVVEDLHWADADSVHFIEQVSMLTLPQLSLIHI